MHAAKSRHYFPSVTHRTCQSTDRMARQAACNSVRRLCRFRKALTMLSWQPAGYVSQLERLWLVNWGIIQIPVKCLSPSPFTPCFQCMCVYIKTPAAPLWHKCGMRARFHRCGWYCKWLRGFIYKGAALEMRLFCPPRDKFFFISNKFWSVPSYNFIF